MSQIPHCWEVLLKKTDTPGLGLSIYANGDSYLWVLASLPVLAQTNQVSVEDFKPASTNQRDSEFPHVNSERRVRARIVAPQAQSVMLCSTVTAKARAVGAPRGARG